MTTGPLRVLEFTNTIARGGVEEHILTLLAGFDRRRIRPYLACSKALAGLLAAALPADVELFPLDFLEPYRALSAWRLARLLLREQIDILHSHLFRSSLCASPVGWLCRVPVVLETPHVRERWRRGWKSSYWIDRMVSRSVDAYIAVSQANAEYLVREKGLPSRKVTVIPNGCELKRFDPRRSPPAGLKESLGFGKDDPVLAVVGRLEPQKGHAVLLRSLAALRREFPRVRLVCVGEGSLRADLQNQVRDLGLEDAVRLVGFQSNVPDWLALADLTVLPSLFEGLPLAAVESLAAGRPVVATAVDGTPEVILDGKTGLTVPPADSEALSRAIARLLADADLRRTLARAGRDWVAESFSHSRQVIETEQLYLRMWYRRRARVHSRSGAGISESVQNPPRIALP